MKLKEEALSGELIPLFTQPTRVECPGVLLTGVHKHISGETSTREVYQSLAPLKLSILLQQHVDIEFCSNSVDHLFKMPPTETGTVTATDYNTNGTLPGVTLRAGTEKLATDSKMDMKLGQEQKSEEGYEHFFWTYTEEPHRTRRMAIIKAHPEVRISPFHLRLVKQLTQHPYRLPNSAAQSHSQNTSAPASLVSKYYAHTSSATPASSAGPSSSRPTSSAQPPTKTASSPSTKSPTTSRSSRHLRTACWLSSPIYLSEFHTRQALGHTTSRTTSPLVSTDWMSIFQRHWRLCSWTTSQERPSSAHSRSCSTPSAQ